MDYSQIPLRDMQMPEAIGWWPLAYGWWVLICVSIVLIVLLARYVLKRLRDPRRYALAELKRIEQAYQQNQDSHQLIMQSNALLKRLALTLYPRDEVASLSGDRWCCFIRETGQLSDQPEIQLLADGPYLPPHADIDSAGFTHFCRQWIKRVEGARHV